MRYNKSLFGMAICVLVFSILSILVDSQLIIEPSYDLISKLQYIAKKFRESYAEMYYDFSRRVKFINFFSNKVDSMMEVFTENLIPLILSEPKINSYTIITLVRYSISLITPLYVISLILTTIYLLFISGSPRGRRIARSNLIKLIIGLGAIMLTIPIIQSFLEISHTLTSLVLSILNPDVNILRPAINFFMSFFIFTTFFGFELGIIFLLISIFLPFSVLFILSLRYLLITLMTALFPFTILFYSFTPTQKLGKNLLYITLLWIFLPLVQATILGVISVSYKLFPLIELSTFISLLGFLLLISTPLIATKIFNFILS